MTNQRTLRVAVLAITLIACSAVLAPASLGQRLDPRFDVGDLFPDLTLPSLVDGSPTRLSDFRGRKVMLHVFASW